MNSSFPGIADGDLAAREEWERVYGDGATKEEEPMDEERYDRMYGDSFMMEEEPLPEGYDPDYDTIPVEYALEFSEKRFAVSPQPSASPDPDPIFEEEESESAPAPVEWFPPMCFEFEE